MKTENFEPRSLFDESVGLEACSYGDAIPLGPHAIPPRCQFDPSQRAQLSLTCALHRGLLPYQTLWLAASVGQSSQLSVQDLLPGRFGRKRLKSLKMTGEVFDCDCQHVTSASYRHAR